MRSPENLFYHNHPSPISYVLNKYLNGAFFKVSTGEEHSELWAYDYLLSSPLKFSPLWIIKESLITFIYSKYLLANGSFIKEFHQPWGPKEAGE